MAPFMWPLGYPASRGYIFAVWAGVRKVASADNHSIFYRSCVKFVTWFVSKINRQVCRQMARVSWEQKKCDNFDLLHKTHVGLTQCSKPVKNRKKPVFLIYSSRFLDGFERLSAEATPAHTAKMLPLLAGYLWAWLFTIFPNFRACLQAICNHSERNNKQQQVLPNFCLISSAKQSCLCGNLLSRSILEGLMCFHLIILSVKVVILIFPSSAWTHKAW